VPGGVMEQNRKIVFEIGAHRSPPRLMLPTGHKALSVRQRFLDGSGCPRAVVKPA
jgi:hypothetical protein